MTLSEQIENIIAQYQLPFAISELHGILSAVVSFNRIDEWKSLQIIDSTASPLIVAIIADIDSQLRSDDFTFTLLVKDADNILNYGEDVAFWAQGFSLVADMLKAHNAMPILDEASIAFVHDVQEFAKLDLRIAETDNNYRQLIEIEEYCRMGALLLYAQTRRSVSC